MNEFTKIDFYDIPKNIFNDNHEFYWLHSEKDGALPIFHFNNGNAPLKVIEGKKR